MHLKPATPILRYSNTPVGSRTAEIFNQSADVENVQEVP